MARFTVSEALDVLARYNGEQGTCKDAPSNLRRLNRVRRIIYELGDYEGTMEWGCLPIDGASRCIYLPYFLETVRQAWISSMPVIVRGSGYMALDSIGRRGCCDCHPDSRRALQVTGLRPPFTATPDGLFQLTIDTDDDAGLVFRGTGRDGSPKVARLSKDAPVSDVMFDKVTSVVKPRTVGDVVVHARFPDGGSYVVANYPGSAINPRYAQMRIMDYCSSDCERDLVVLAKRTFIPYEDLDELVDIESMQALVFGSQAINSVEGNRDEEYVRKIGLMRGQLSQVDQDMSMHEGSVEMEVRHSLALSPRFDRGGRVA